MPSKSRLSAAALASLVAMSAMAATNANAFFVGPTSAESRLCDGAVSRPACGDHIKYIEALRSRPHHGDTSPAYMRNLDSRDHQAMGNPGGGGGGGGGR